MPERRVVKLIVYASAGSFVLGAASDLTNGKAPTYDLPPAFAFALGTSTDAGAVSLPNAVEGADFDARPAHDWHTIRVGELVEPQDYIGARGEPWTRGTST